MDWTERDEQVLAHIALYRVSFHRVLARLFFENRARACWNVLERLKSRGAVESVPVGGGPLRYYRLTPGEAARRGVAHRAIGLGSRALPEAIAVLWFATMSPRPRHRLERSELEELFGRAAPSGPHCIEEGTPPRVFRVYVPGPQTKPATVLATVRDLVTAARQNAALSSWLDNALYGYAVLVSSEARKKRLEAAIAAHDLAEHATIVVSLTPDTTSLGRAIHGLDQRS